MRSVVLTVDTIWVEHVLREEDARDLNDVVDRTTESSSQGSKADRRCLSDDDPRCRSRAESEENGDDQAEGGLCQVGCVVDTD